MAETVNQTNERMMTALFRDGEMADKALQELLDRGYSRDEVSVLMSEDTRNRYHGAVTDGDPGNENRVPDEKVADLTLGTTLGTLIGGMIGAVVAASVATAGFGLILLGPIAATAFGATAGAAAGGLAGNLVARGMPESTAHGYEQGLREGGIVLGFNPRSEAEAREVETVWQRYNGELLHY